MERIFEMCVCLLYKYVLVKRLLNRRNFTLVGNKVGTNGVVPSF